MIYLEQEKKFSSDKTAPIPISVLNKLTNLVTELVLIRNQNMEAVSIRNFQQISAVNQQLNVVTSDIQNCIMLTRMHPVTAIFEMIKQEVKNFARECNKKIEIEFTGADMVLDKSIIDILLEQVLLLLKFAIEFGIESAQTRKKAEKSISGKLKLELLHFADQIMIRVQDDGAGMPVDSIRGTLLKQKILSAEATKNLPDNAILPYIFEQKELFFLPEEKISLYNFPAIRSHCKRLGGTIECSSPPGKGTTFFIKLPLSLGIMPALIVSVEDHCFAIPQTNVLEVVWLHGEEVFQSIKLVDEKEVYWLRGKLLPLLRLSEVLEIPKTYIDPVSHNKKPERREQKPDRRQGETSSDENRRLGVKERRTADCNSVFIVVIRLGEEKFGLIVDFIEDTEEIVVKSMHSQMKSAQVFGGITVLGDSRIAMILDLPALARKSHLHTEEIKNEQTAVIQTKKESHIVLLFDLGDEERFAIPLTLLKRVQEIEKNEIQVVGKKEFLNYHQEMIPLVRLDSIVPSFKAKYAKEKLFVIIPQSPHPFGIIAQNIQDTFDIPIELTLEKTLDIDDFVIDSKLIHNKLTLFIDPFAILRKMKWGGNSLKDKRILYCGTSSFYKEIITSFLNYEGAKVISSDIDKTDENALDVVLYEQAYNLSEIKGWLKEIKSKESLKKTPVIYLSSKESVLHRSQIVQAGIQNFVLKFHIPVLYDTINKVLGLKND